MALADIIKYGQLKLADDSLFAEFSSVKIEDEVEQYNYCPDCKVPMVINGADYQCESCGLVQVFNPETTKEAKPQSSYGRFTGSNRRTRYYSVMNDYARTQRKAIETQLRTNNLNFVPKIADEILMNVAAKYNQIQNRFITDENGTQKKFVRRGNIKDEVLASLIYFECMAKGATRKKKDIAAFMHLPANGFSRGEEILLTLQASGLIDLPTDANVMVGFVDRYLEALNIAEPEYRDFVIDIVTLSEEKRIGMDSHLSSKVVGAIWMLICQYNIPITISELERAADNTKRNTFMKFQALVYRHAVIFAPLLQKYFVAHIKKKTSRCDYSF